MADKKSQLWQRVLVTGGAGFIGSNLAMEIQNRRPESHIAVMDDFRSGNFENLREFKGDVIAMDAAAADIEEVLSERPPTLVFHLASITNTTVTDQRLMVHDNVEGFRRVMDFCIAGNIPLVYASSAATYGIAEGRMSEDTPPAPANIYAFSKMIFDNLAREAMAEYPEWHIVGLKYFNVYGPNEAHKQIASSMIYHLSQQIKAGKRPRVFKHGEQKRDFVYVKDAVEATLLAAGCGQSGIYNVGTGKARSFNELVQILNDVLGTDYQPEYFDCPYPFYQPFTEADLTGAREGLGYKPGYSLEDGVRDYMRLLYAQA